MAFIIWFTQDTWVIRTKSFTLIYQLPWFVLNFSTDSSMEIDSDDTTDVTKTQAWKCLVEILEFIQKKKEQHKGEVVMVALFEVLKR